VTDDIPELSAADFQRSILAEVRRRVAEGRIESGSDIVAIRRFVGLTAVDFAHAFGITLETLHDWEAGRSRPDGPALSLLRVAARHPRAVRENRKGASHQIWAICTRQLPSFSRFGGWHLYVPSWGRP
jgi:putative transcriptional regulator